MNKINQIPYNNYLLALIIPTLILGPLIPEIIIFYFNLYFFYLLIFKKQQFKIKYLSIFLLFYFYLNFSSFFFSKNIQTLDNSIFYFRFFIFSIIFYYLIIIDKSILSTLYYVIFFTVIILTSDLIFQYIFRENIIGYPIVDNARMTSFFKDEKIAGSFLSKLFPVYLYLNFFLNKKNIDLIIFFIFTTIGIILSGEKTALLIFIMTIIILSFLVKSKDKKGIIKFSIITILILVIITFYDANYKKKFAEILNTISIKENKILILWSQERKDFTLTAFNMFDQNKLFGQGFNSFRFKCNDIKFNQGKKYPCTTHPHNYYLQFLAELGLFGISFLLLFYFIIIYRIFRINFLKIYKKKTTNIIII